MYFDRNMSENKDGKKKNEGHYLSCVRNGEFYFTGFMITVCCPGLFVREGGTEGRGDARSMTDCSPCFPEQNCRNI